ncbi:24622_t:CDS:2, partial [Dentiscutata erythropus]
MNPSEDEIKKSLNEEHIEFYEYSCFKDVKLIGEGGYGKVYSAILKSNEITVAIKSFKNNVAIKEVVKELKLHSRVDMHSNIIRLHGATKNEDDIEQHQLASLILDIKDGVRESPIEGTPSAYVKIYTDCWQYDPDIRPDIQQVFLNLRGLSINDEQAISRSAHDINHVSAQIVNQNSLNSRKFLIVIV